MSGFKSYLQQKHFTESTVTTYCYLATKFLTYKDIAECEESEDFSIDYKEILTYIKYLRRNNNDTSVNLHLVALRHYFNYRNVQYNPVKLHIKRQPTLISSKTLSREQLHHIYDSYPNTSNIEIRDKVLLGLFIFQGIQSHEVKNIYVEDINLDKLTLTIKQSNNSNKRVLPLDIKQVLLLSKYLTVTRNEMVSNSKEQALIVTSKNKNSTRSILNQLNKKLPKLPYQPNLRLIRTSVIKNWLKTHDLRTVQYYAGHKYISSTESYLSKDLQHLKNSVIKFHPM